MGGVPASVFRCVAWRHWVAVAVDRSTCVAATLPHSLACGFLFVVMGGAGETRLASFQSYITVLVVRGANSPRVVRCGKLHHEEVLGLLQKRQSSSRSSTSQGTPFPGPGW